MLPRRTSSSRFIRATRVALCLVPTGALLIAACGGDTIDALDLTDGGSASRDATIGDSNAGRGASDGDLSGEDAQMSNDAGADATTDGDDDSSEPDAQIDAGADGADTLDAAADAHAEGGDADAGDAGLGLLQSAKKFAVLAGSAITITPSNLTTITGDVGVSPGTSIMTLPAGQPLGTVYAGGPIAAQAESDLTAAYNALTAQPCLPANNRAGIDLGGMTLAPGVYCFPNTSAGITGTLTLDAQLDPNATWVIQIGTTLTTASNSAVRVINGGSACNVHWAIGTSATLGTGTAFAGNVIAATSITMVTGSSISVGRALARNGAVSLDANVISAAACQ